MGEKIPVNKKYTKSSTSYKIYDFIETTPNLLYLQESHGYPEKRLLSQIYKIMFNAIKISPISLPILSIKIDH